MKRFYCTICARVKRVRSYPQNIQNVHSDVVDERTGTCARHSITPVQSFTPKVEVKLPVKALLNSPVHKEKRRA